MTFSDMAFGSFRFVFPTPSGAGGLTVISTSRLYLCIRHCGRTQQAFSRGNSSAFTDGCFDSAHYRPLAVDVSLFLLYRTQSSWRLWGVRRFLVLIVLRIMACNALAS